MSGNLEALYIFDGNRPILTHVYASRPLSACQLLPLYTAYGKPRPNLIYASNTNPPTLIFSLIQSNLLFIITTTSEIEPLLVLEFLHRVVDVFEEFLGSPLLAPKIESSYDIVAQLLNQMCDSGCISTTEPNSLRDLVEVEGWVDRLLGNIAIPGKANYPGYSSSKMTGISSSSRSLPTSTTAMPWRRANVRHNTNEIYVDIIEKLSVTIAPSGRPLAAFANGSIIVTSKITGVPELQLNLTVPSGKQNINNVIEFPAFHPCVRLARWKENPGEISFIPPDGKFLLAGYGVDLLPVRDLKTKKLSSPSLKLPVDIEVKTSLGPTGSEFEVRLLISNVSSQGEISKTISSSRGAFSSANITSGFGASAAMSNKLSLKDLVVKVPLPKDLRNLSEIRASRGETIHSSGERCIEWRIPVKEATVGSATLRCTVSGALSGIESDFKSSNFDIDSSYGYQEDAYRSATLGNTFTEVKTTERQKQRRDSNIVSKNKFLMPDSATVSFSVQGWLASGIKVEKLFIDTRNSRGLGDSIRSYKGVKYLTVSRDDINIRC